MDKLKIRRYKKKDNPVVWQLHRVGLVEIGIIPRRNGLWDRDINDIENVYFKGGEFIVGELQGQVVAMGAFKKIDDELVEIKRMRVHPNFQRRGFGEAILIHLEKKAKEMGYKKVTLDTSKKMIKAQNFYKKMGYKKVNKELPKDRRKAHRIIGAVFYEKELI